MSFVNAFAVYFVIWWVTLFAVLPWGVRSQAEEGSVVTGSDPGAPSRPRLLRIIVANSLVAGVVFAGLWWALDQGIIGHPTPPVRG